MKTLKRRDFLIIGAALISVLFYVLMAQRAGGLGFPLDDSWIHQTYGRNLATLGKWTYAPPYAPSAGSTSPLYTVLLAIGYFLHIPFFLWTYGLGAIALAALGVVGARLGERFYAGVPAVGTLTGLALVLAWHLIWAASSGMETVIFSLWGLLLINLIWAQLDDSRARFVPGILFGVIGALLIATRPEGALLIGLAGLLMLIARPGRNWRELILWIIGAGLGFSIAIAPYLLLNYSLNGTLLPNTAAAKQAENAYLLMQGFLVNLWAMILPLSAGGQLLLVPGAIVGVIRVIRRLRSNRREILFLLPLAWAIGHICLFALFLPAPYQHGRYVIPALPPFIVFSVGGIVTLVAAKRLNLPQRVLVRSLALTAIGVFLIFWLLGARIFATDVHMIESDMGVASRWLAQNIPADQLLAVHDIGEVGYFAPRPMLDIAGLISPEAIPVIRQYVSGDTNAFKAFLQSHGAKYLMVLESQWHDPDHDPNLCSMFNANGGMGGMRIYRITWDGNCS